MPNCGVEITRLPRFKPIPSEKAALHNIHPNMVAVCYRRGDSESKQVADYYAEMRNIPSTNLVSLPCLSHDNILTEQQYIDQIETPIWNALYGTGSELGVGSGLVSSAHMADIWVIVLCYNVPYVFESNERDLLSVASRLHIIGNSSPNKHPNYTYDRKTWRFFNAEDASGLMMVSHLDAPCSEIAQILIDRSVEIDIIPFVTGSINIDPYGKKFTNVQLEYEDDLVDFIERDSENFGLSVSSTVDLEDPYQDPQIHVLNGDSFYWGWYTPFVSYNLFEESSKRRVFLYNADDEGVNELYSPIDVNNSDRWCKMCISTEPGYASCAGTVNSPGEDAYLRPRPLFEALFRGACLGEAFLYSSPYVNWKIMLIGDPLMVVNFPTQYEDPGLHVNESIRLLQRSVERSYAWGLRQAALAQLALNQIVESEDLNETDLLLHPIYDWYQSVKEDVQVDLFTPVTLILLRYVLETTGITWSDWLILHNERTTTDFRSLVQKVSSASITDIYVYAVNQWRQHMNFEHNNLTLEHVHFQLEVANDEDFTDIIFNIRSNDSVTGWYYEKELYEFTAFPGDGMMSNYSGRRVRFVSPVNYHLTKGEQYWIRWKPLYFNDDSTQSWQSNVAFVSERIVV